MCRCVLIPVFLETVKIKIFSKYACAAFMQTSSSVQSKTPWTTQDHAETPESKDCETSCL